MKSEEGMSRHKRGEAGFKFEQNLFGVTERVAGISQDASNFLLNYKNYPPNIADFREAFGALNASLEKGYLSLQRGNGKFEGVICNVKFM